MCVYIVYILYIDIHTLSHAGCISSTVWGAVKELKVSYHNPKTILFTIDPYYGHLKIKVVNSNPVVGPHNFIWEFP